jgi:hypothetical protein
MLCDAVCFTVCLCTSPDLDGYQGTKDETCGVVERFFRRRPGAAVLGEQGTCMGFPRLDPWRCILIVRSLYRWCVYNNFFGKGPWSFLLLHDGECFLARCRPFFSCLFVIAQVLKVVIMIFSRHDDCVNDDFGMILECLDQ